MLISVALDNVKFHYQQHLTMSELNFMLAAIILPEKLFASSPATKFQICNFINFARTLIPAQRLIVGHEKSAFCALASVNSSASLVQKFIAMELN